MDDGLEASADMAKNASAIELDEENASLNFSEPESEAESVDTSESLCNSPGSQKHQNNQTDEFGFMEDLHIEEAIQNKTFLYCKICRKVYSNPILVTCLHTFCKDCLLNSKVDDSNKFNCPVCRRFSFISDKDLLPNTVMMDLVSRNANGRKIPEYCVICSLHKEEREATGQCLDCGDVLCQDCCEKHTYSRLTLNHRVISLDAASSKSLLQQRSNHFTTCGKHFIEDLRYYCVDCCQALCRDCIVLDHKSHSIVSTADAAEKKRREILAKVDSLKLNLAELQSVDADYLELLKNEEEAQKKILEEETKNLVSLIEEKSKLCKKKLEMKFTARRKKYRDFQHFLHNKQRALSCSAELVNFYLKEGRDDEVLAMEGHIEAKLNSIKGQRVYKPPSSLPKVILSSDDDKALKEMQLFSVLTEKEEKTKEVKKEKEESSRTRRRLRRPKNQSSLLGSYSGQSSILGAYPVQNMGALSINQPGSYACSRRISKSKPEPTRNRKVYTAINLKLVQSLGMKVFSDDSEPEITGMVFINNQDFAVSDKANRKIKVFSRNGKFLDMISDVEPLSLTVCQNHLVWNSQSAKVHVKQLNMKSKYLHTKSFTADTTHPVSSFNNMKYIVANIRKAKISAYLVSGQHVHDVFPTGQEGQSLTDVTSIATRHSDQVVMVDSLLKMVIINSFDGIFTGSYSAPSEPNKPDWDPCCVCVDNKNNIFVTDRARNKVILLSPTGEFIQEWVTLLEHPSSLACNGEGLLLVSGRGQKINLYQYHY